MKACVEVDARVSVVTVGDSTLPRYHSPWNLHRGGSRGRTDNVMRKASVQIADVSAEQSSAAYIPARVTAHKSE